MFRLDLALGSVSRFSSSLASSIAVKYLACLGGAFYYWGEKLRNRFELLLTGRWSVPVAGRWSVPVAVSVAVGLISISVRGFSIGAIVQLHGLPVVDVNIIQLDEYNFFAVCNAYIPSHAWVFGGSVYFPPSNVLNHSESVHLVMLMINFLEFFLWNDSKISHIVFEQRLVEKVVAW